MQPFLAEVFVLFIHLRTQQAFPALTWFLREDEMIKPNV